VAFCFILPPVAELLQLRLWRCDCLVEIKSEIVRLFQPGRCLLKQAGYSSLREGQILKNHTTQPLCSKEDLGHAVTGEAARDEHILAAWDVADSGHLVCRVAHDFKLVVMVSI
jgi:hypothetical protein